MVLGTCDRMYRNGDHPIGNLQTQKAIMEGPTG